ncbi:hypothetical protein ACT7DH_10770 [Bacillus pacificus]
MMFFIMNVAFLYGLLQLFNEHEHLGMIGMIELIMFPPNGME